MKRDRPAVFADDPLQPDQHHAFLEHRNGFQPHVGGRVVDQRHVDIGGEKVQQRRARQAFGQRQVQLWIISQDALEERHADRLHRRIGHADRHVARDLAARSLDVALGGLHRPQDRFGVRIEPLARRRRLQPARLAVEQAMAEFGFQIGQVVAQRRDRDAQLAGRRGEAAFFEDGLEIAELARIHGFLNPERCLRNFIILRSPFERYLASTSSSSDRRRCS